MSVSELLDPNDASTITEIMLQTCSILQAKAPRVTRDRDFRTFSEGAKRLDLIGASPYCGPVSDAVTRAAHGLGIVASREMHAYNRKAVANHYLTSFGPLNEPLSDNDPILCATWGQFARSAFDKRLSKNKILYGFFGRRRDIKNLVSLPTYSQCYSVGSTAFRQTVHALMPPQAQTAGLELYDHTWLETTPEDILTGQYPASVTSIADYPVDMWEFTPLLLRAIAAEDATGGSSRSEENL